MIFLAGAAEGDGEIELVDPRAGLAVDLGLLGEAVAHEVAGAQGAQAGPQPGAGNAQQEEKKNDDDVVDADFTDVNDKK